jgi:hypothetical protein
LLSIAQHRQRGPPCSQSHLARPTEHQRPGHDQRHAGEDAPINAFFEHKPGQHGSEHPFGIEQQRRT